MEKKTSVIRCGGEKNIISTILSLRREDKTLPGQERQFKGKVDNLSEILNFYKRKEERERREASWAFGSAIMCLPSIYESLDSVTGDFLRERILHRK